MSANCMKAKMLSAALFAALVLSAMQSVRAEEATFEVTWLGKNDKSWTDSEVWDSATPEAWQTAIITNSSLIKFKAETGKTVVSNIVVGANVSPTFQRADSATTGQHLLVQEMNGDGTLKLNRVGIHADYSHYDTCNISVAKIEAVANGNNDSWFDGGSASGKRMVVNSDITVNGFLKVYKQTTLAGETTLAGKLLMVDEAVVVNNLVYAGDDATIDSASKGSVGRLTVRSGTLSYSTLPTGVTFGSLVLDGGTVSVGDGTALPASGLSLGVLSGGYIALTISDADFAAGGTPAYPSGLTFGNDADLSKVVAVVKNASGDAQKKYAITKTGEAYSFAELVPGDTVTWIGGGADSNWNTAGNWLYGAVPTAGQAVVFNYSADVIIDQDVVLPAISTLTVGTGAEVSLRYRCTSGDVWYHGGNLPVVTIQKKVTGDGTLRLQHVELVGAEGASVECAELEILPFENNDQWRDTKITGPTSGSPFAIAADVSGGGYLHMYNRLALSGDNSVFAGRVVFSSSDADGKTDRYFNAPESFFPNASPFEFYGKAFIGFTEGTARLGNVTMGESWGAAFLVKYGAQVIFEVESGSIRDTHFGNGFEVRTCAQDSETDSNSTDGCAGLTIKKVGEGTLVYGVTKAHNLVVAEGRVEFTGENVEFTGENNNGDDSDVNVTVKAGASIGSSEAFSHENPNWTLGGDVTHRGRFTFDDEESVAKVYVEAGDATETVASAKRTLTLSGNNKAFTTMVTADPALNQWLDGDAAEREAKLNTPNSHGINGIQAYMIGYPTFTDDTVPSLAVGVSEDNFSFNFDIGKSSARKVDGLAVNYSLKSSSDMVNWKNVGSATVSGGAVAASAEALSTDGPYVKLCAEVVPTE